MTENDFVNYLQNNSAISSPQRIKSYVALLNNILTVSNWGTPKPIDSINSVDDLYNLINTFVKSNPANPGQLRSLISQSNGGGHAIMGHFIDALKSVNSSQASREGALRQLIKRYNNRSNAKSSSGQVNSSTSSSAGNDDELGNTSDAKTKEEKYAELLSHVYNIVLHGAPGTGKTYLAKEIARELGCDKNAIKMVQFHPSYDYTDFMEGLRPVKENGNIGFERRDGAFKAFCKKALRNPEKKYIFIIDEINRGEISKILGECMFSIDPGYVGEEGKIETQYQNLIDDGDDDPFKGGFYRPENVYIIGTMNDIDRGVESMDLAMRRRFTFIEIKAEHTMDEILNTLKNQDDKETETAQRVMKALNNKIKGTEGLGEDYCIGASYFLKLDAYDGDNDKWKCLWDNHLKSLLKEYVRGLENSSLIDDLHKTYWEAVDPKRPQESNLPNDADTVSATETETSDEQN